MEQFNMEQLNREDMRQWVAEQTALLDPPEGWHPIPGAALGRFHARTRKDHARDTWTAWALAAAIVIAVIVWWPVGRGLAQQFWNFLSVPRVAVIRVNPWPEGVPSPEVKLTAIPVPPLPARDLEEARWRVHYDPRLPRPNVLATSPRISTTFPMAARTIVKTADLELALQRAGVTGLTVPPQWNGAQVALHTSAMVIAEWPDVVLVQSLPLTLTSPAGFDFAAFSTLVLRVVGVGADEAKQLAQRMGTAPPWLAPLDRNFHEAASLEEVTLNSGPATLWVDEHRVTLMWSVPDRVYLLNGNLSRQLMIAVANSVQ